MKKYKNKYRGFSLVELLISLIVISCVTAAFAPLITKKFSSGFLGGGTSMSSNCSNNGNFGSDCKLCTDTTCLDCGIENCKIDEFKNTTKCACIKCSDKFGAQCSECNEIKCLACASGFQLSTDATSENACVSGGCDGPNYMQIGALCVTRKNMGDSDNLSIPDTVNIVNTGTSCNSEYEKCCWQGQTADQCDSANGDYSGCNRTLCDWNAANEICSKFNGLGKTWRLATIDEMANWANNSIGIGNEGLQLCDTKNDYSSSTCVFSTKCSGCYLSECIPYSLWAKNISDNSNAYMYSLSSKTWQNKNYYKTAASSVRCVADMTNCREKYGEHCLECNYNECTKCDSGYQLTTNPASNNACATGNFNCGGDDFIQIDNLCVTKKNMGDSATLAIPNTVTKVNAGTQCDSNNQKCCWQGSTSTTCNDENGAYSGCERTVCNWEAANEICNKFNHGGRTWRLATNDEMNTWAFNSIAKEDNGARLCDEKEGYSSAACSSKSACQTGGNCFPFYLWSADLDGTLRAKYSSLSTRTYSTGSSLKSAAYSVRCVTEAIYSCKDKFGPNCATCNETECLSCERHYKVKVNPTLADACEFDCSGPDFMQIGNLCITRKNIDTLHNKLKEYESSYETVLYLSDLGFSTKDAMLVYNHYKDKVKSVIEKDIYQLEYDIYELSFKKIDRIALKNGVEQDAMIRVRASILYIMEEVSNTYGHSYFFYDEIFNYLPRVLGVFVGDTIYQEALGSLIVDSMVVNRDEKYYLKEMYNSECFIVKRFRLLARGEKETFKNLDLKFQEMEEVFGISYNKEQKEAILRSVSENFLVITGGPGTGKTTIMRGIVELYKELHKLSYEKLAEKIALLAPTGRAAKRMSDATLMPASTIHRFLKWQKDTNKFQVNEYHKSKVEMVILDEASMVDTLLMAHLLRGISANCKIIMVGDSYQLPSVGPGQVLHDVISSGKLPVVSLKELYRQGKDSNILMLAYDVRNGVVEDDVFNKEDDLTFIECRDDDVISNLMDVSSTFKDLSYNSFEYDSNGNLVVSNNMSVQTNEFKYDQKNQLVKIADKCNVEFIEVPSENSYDKIDSIYDKIIQKLNSSKMEYTILISAGPMAKVLVYRLAKVGIVSYDTGHCFDEPLNLE